MKQANYNGRLRGSVGGVGRGVDSLAPPPGCDLFGYHIFPPHVASLRAAQYGVTHGCDPSGVPCSLCEQLGCRLRALRCRFECSLCEQMGSRLRALRCRFEHCSANNCCSRLRALRCSFEYSSASNWVADCVPCDADLASLPMGTNAASLQCRFALSGLCSVALPFHDVKVRFKFRGY